jgi:hypothetical protein
MDAGHFLKSNNLDIIFKYSLPILSFGLIMLSLILYKSKLKTIKQMDSLSQKLEKFKKALKIKYSFIEAVSLYSLAASLSTGNYQYLIIVVLAIAIKFMIKPSPGNVLAGLKLNDEETIAMSGGSVIPVPVKEKPFLIRYPVLAVVIISFSLYSAYDVILGLLKKEEWSPRERAQMVNDCILKAKETAVKYPVEVKAYCECTNEAIFKKYTHQEIRENNQLSSDELLRTMSPVFVQCLAELRGKIKEKENIPH